MSAAIMLMGSFDLQRWTRIGAMNRAIGAPRTASVRFGGFRNLPRRCSALRFLGRAGATESFLPLRTDGDKNTENKLAAPAQSQLLGRT